MSGVRQLDCAPVCPVREFCGAQQRVYEKAHEMVFGTEGGAPGIAATAMELDEQSARTLGFEERAEAALETARFLIDRLDALRPPALDFDAMAEACDGPIENRNGLLFGFDATLRCGSTAIGEDLRRGSTKITEKAPETTE